MHAGWGGGGSSSSTTSASSLLRSPSPDSRAGTTRARRPAGSSITWASPGRPSPIGAIDPEDFYDFQVNRPVVEIEGGRTQRLIWPTTRISLARAPARPRQRLRRPVPPTGLTRDVVLVHGIEPNMRWRAFSEELVQGLESLGVELIILLGALLADAPHTRPVPVPSARRTPDRRRRRRRADRLQGPDRDRGGAPGHLHRSGIPTVSLWAQVPHYVAQPPSPKATLALLRGGRGRPGRCRCRWPTCPRRRGPGSAAWTSWRSRIPRSPTTCGRWKRPRTRWTCPRPAATRSRASSSVISGAMAAPGGRAVSDPMAVYSRVPGMLCPSRLSGGLRRR